MPSHLPSARNKVRITGSGLRPIIFLHGLGSDQTCWRHVAPSFQTGNTIVTYDITGCGGSDLAFYDYLTYSSLSAHAADLLEICIEFGLQDVALVGHSAGAMIAALAVLRDPSRFRRLAMIGASPCYLNDGEYNGGFSRQELAAILESQEADYTLWSRAMAPVLMGDVGRPDLFDDLATSFCQGNTVIARHMSKVTLFSDLRAKMPQLALDTLILQSPADAMVPVAVGEWLNAHIAGSRFDLLRATGHYAHISAPEETVSALAAFLHA